jgi:diacylglycerol kinase (ATP)
MGLENTLLFYAGMDAQVAYGFHQLRDEKPFLASGPLSNKVINWGMPFTTFLAVQ